MVVLVQDMSNNYFQVGIYNLINKKASISECQKLLPIGCKIGFKDPYLKSQASGYLGLRVDNPENMEIINTCSSITNSLISNE